MSGASESQSNSATTKAITDDSTNTPALPENTKPTAQLEEDDEFEDFPVEDWGDEETDGAETNTHLWEESWDDDDTSEDFAKMLKEELKKVDAKKQ